MIPRADFAVVGDDVTLDLFQNFVVSNLEKQSPVLSLLRKPDFQRETNHWTPDQVVAFLSSFVDSELIPSLILWKSPTHIFDGGHPLSALRAWMEDDYGDGAISHAFYGNDITQEQIRIARRTRKKVEGKICRYTALKSLVGKPPAARDLNAKRAAVLFTRGLNLQWVQGDAAVAESTFFKINSQGTPLDETEELLLRNRKKGIAIAARAIVRAAAGHKYWSAFNETTQEEIEKRAKAIYHLVFQPEVSQPIKTLELPLGGSTAPIDALGLLIETVTITDTKKPRRSTLRMTRTAKTQSGSYPMR